MWKLKNPRVLTARCSICASFSDPETKCVVSDQQIGDKSYTKNILS
jgi:hypothetical protein